MNSVSVIIPFYANRSDILNMVLKELLLQKDKVDQEVEIIVVNDGSPIHPGSVVVSGIKMIDLLINRGRSAARNSGASVASGDYLVFLDSDCIPCDGFFYEIGRVIEKGLSVVCGNVKNLNSNSKYSKYRFPSTCTQGVFEIDFQSFCTGCCIIEKKVLHLLNGFDETLKLFEDIELAYRVNKAGVKIYMSAELAVFHNDLDLTAKLDASKVLAAYRYLRLNSSPDFFNSLVMVRKYKLVNPFQVRVLCCLNYFLICSISFFEKFLPYFLLKRVYHLLIYSSIVRGLRSK